MSKGVEKPNDSELLKDLQSIYEIKERVKSIELIRLKELIIYLTELNKRLYTSIINRLISYPHETFEYSAKRTSQNGFNYNDLEYLKELIQNKINSLSVKQTNTFNDLIFKDAPSKNFFEYLIIEWFNNKLKPKSAISFVYYLMRTNDNDLSTKFKGLKYIIKDIRQIDFALYWNENYKELHKHKYSIKIDFKTARLKTFNEIPTETYINKLNEFVEKFENKN